MNTWKLSAEEILTADPIAKKLKLLWVYSAEDAVVNARHNRLMDKARLLGYNVIGIRNTFSEEGYRWYTFPELDRMWRRKHPLLMKLYETIAMMMEQRDVLILYNGANLHPDFVRQLPGIKAYTFGDPESWDHLAGPIGPAFHLHFANQPSQIQKFRDNGMPNVHFFPLASQVFPEDTRLSDESVLDTTGRTVPATLFCGRTGWRNDRLDRIAAAFPNAVIKGSGWPAGRASYQEIHDTYLKAQVGWNIHNTSGFNFRTYDLAAYGVLQLCDCREDIPWIFELDTEIIGYDSISDCIEKTRYYLAHPKEQRHIALRAWHRYLKDFTPLANWEYLVKRIALFSIGKNVAKISSQPFESYQCDLSGKKYWDERYICLQKGAQIGSWKPNDYTTSALAKTILGSINKTSPTSVLEIGCGNSVWLPFVALHCGVKVSGLDYSESGCLAAQKNLDAAGVSGNIYCEDMFSPRAELKEQFDFVYSLGVVEHFTNQLETINALMKFVRPGGYLFTEIPNMSRSLHALLSRIWQPEVYANHVPLSLEVLSDACYSSGMHIEDSGYIGLFSLNIVAWGVEPRWPNLEKVLLPVIRRSVNLSEKILLRMNVYETPFKSLSPFIFVLSRKPESKAG